MQPLARFWPCFSLNVKWACDLFVAYFIGLQKDDISDANSLENITLTIYLYCNIVVEHKKIAML
jgi:hypothetical protein